MKTTMKKTMRVTEETMASAFTEWDRRYREEPERFQSEAVRLLKSDADTYGKRCAPYFAQLLFEQQQANRIESSIKKLGKAAWRPKRPGLQPERKN